MHIFLARADYKQDIVSVGDARVNNGMEQGSSK
jgi:hypothetical protein